MFTFSTPAPRPQLSPPPGGGGAARSIAAPSGPRCREEAAKTAIDSLNFTPTRRRHQKGPEREDNVSPGRIVGRRHRRPRLSAVAAAVASPRLSLFTCRLVGPETFSGSATTKQIQSSADSPPSSLRHLRPPAEADKNALAGENRRGEVSPRTFLTAPGGCCHYKLGYFPVQERDAQLVWVRKLDQASRAASPGVTS